MARFRITVDIEARSVEEALDHLRWFGGKKRRVGVDRLVDSDTVSDIRTITFYRRATTATDTAGDFLPSTQPCQGDTFTVGEGTGEFGKCEEIAEALIGWSNGKEERVCLGHLQEYAGVLLQREVDA